METDPEFFAVKYKIKVVDKEEAIEDIAFKLNLKKKGGKADVDRASRKILLDWMKGPTGQNN
jgi:ribosome biogenesis GTPase A